MRFQLDITLTEDDYLAFNNFHAIQSKSGKKINRRGRIFFLTFVAVLMALVLLAKGWTTFSAVYAILLGLYTALYMLFYNRIIKRNIKSQLKRLKKIGKLPFDPVCKMEFHEDRLVEITDAKRFEESYAALERICVVEDQFIVLYNSSVGGHILPIPQLKAQLEQEEFLRFLSQKCHAVEYYEP